MYAKSFIIFSAAAASLTPTVLAQGQDQGDVFNFDCGHKSSYGYGYGGNNGNSGNNGGNVLTDVQDIIDAFTDISNMSLNGSTLIRGIDSGSLPQGATDLFQHIHDIVCLEQDLHNSLSNNLMMTDNEQHNLCHAKSFLDLTHDNLLMNIENKASDLLGAFQGGSNTPATLPASLRGLLQSYEPLGTVLTEVASICQSSQTTSHSTVSNVFQQVLSTLGL